MNLELGNIVITGFSAVTAAGAGIDPILELIRTEGNALSPVPDGIAGVSGQRWGKANDFKATDFIPPLKARKMDRCSQFAVAAAGLALTDANIDLKTIEPQRIGIALGCGFGGVANSAEFLTGYFQNGVNGLSPMLFPNTVSNASASNASIEYGIKGPNVTLVQRFCSAESAFMMACRFIAERRADIMLTGGADDLTQLMMSGFSAIGQLKRYASCFGEGSGIVVLENAAHAARRGAVPRAVVESINTVALMPQGREDEGIERLFADADLKGLIAISGTASNFPPIMRRLAGRPLIDIATLIGRSLAMGGTSIATLLASLGDGQSGLLLSASPEGPYYAIRFSGGTPVQS
jgi:hypothetical protein